MSLGLAESGGLLLAGCVTEQPVSFGGLFRHDEAFSGAAGRDVVVMEVAMLEVPIGDRYVNEEFWINADEQIIAAEHRALIEDNGFRVGRIGNAPSPLQALIESKRSNPDPRRIEKRAGSGTTLTIGPTLPYCQFEIHDEVRATPVAVQNADCTLLVTPVLLPDGRTRLEFVPQVPHGQAAITPRPAADRSGWELHSNRATESYSKPDLGRHAGDRRIRRDRRSFRSRQHPRPSHLYSHRTAESDATSAGDPSGPAATRTTEPPERRRHEQSTRPVVGFAGCLPHLPRLRAD